MKQSGIVKDFAAMALCLVTLAASVFFKSEPTLVVLLSFSIVLLVGLFSLDRRHNLPLLFLILLIKVLALPIAYVLADVDVLIYYLASALIDLLMALCIVLYHNDQALYRWFRVQKSAHVPQVYLMALMLAISSLVSCLQAIEYLRFVLDENVYQDGPPFISSHQVQIKLVLKLMFDLCIWSLLLEPNRWKVLRKIQDKFLAP